VVRLQKEASMPGDYGPLGTRNLGRAERVARSEREFFRHVIAVEEEQGRVQQRNEFGYTPAELRSLQEQVRRLTDHLADERRARLALEEQVADLIEAVKYVDAAHMEVSRNGTAQPNH
jgi:hypothetical protein